MSDRHPKERRIPALAVSRGFAVGPIYFFEDDGLWGEPIHLPPEGIESEIRRFRSAVDTTISQLKDLASDPDPSAQEPAAHILGVQLLMIEGSPFIERVESVISEHRANAAWAVTTVAGEYLKQQSGVANQHLREKRLDIEDVAARLIKSIDGNENSLDAERVSGRVIVTRELRPSAVMEFAKQRPAAFVTERGGWTSHSSIIAREFRIPMVSGVRELRKTFSGVARVMVDGLAGAVILDPAPGTRDHTGSVTRLRPIADRSPAGPAPAVTNDGIAVTIRANLDTVAKYEMAEKAGATGIGLFRSESLIHRGNFPSGDAQFNAYKELADRVGLSGIKVRTFDIGIDDLAAGSKEENPALGLRSLRLSLADPGEFRIQVRAILRASAGRTIDIVLPMVSDVADLARARRIIDEEGTSLTDQEIAIGKPGIGAMIETPSAVMIIDAIARGVDLLCLGTNDLVQYLLAVDRDNQSVADWYQSLHPAVLRAIESVIAAGKRREIPVQICGEMAASLFYVPLLIGLGARELSINTGSIESVGRLIRGIRADDCTALAQRSLENDTAQQTEHLLRSHYSANWPDLFPPELLASRHP